MGSGVVASIYSIVVEGPRLREQKIPHSGSASGGRLRDWAPAVCPCVDPQGSKVHILKWLIAPMWLDIPRSRRGRKSTMSVKLSKGHIGVFSFNTLIWQICRCLWASKLCWIVSWLECLIAWLLACLLARSRDCLRVYPAKCFDCFLPQCLNGLLLILDLVIVDATSFLFDCFYNRLLDCLVA